MAKVKITPSQRTASWLAEQGYVTGTVERFIHPGSFVGAGHRKDLFGCIDQIAVRPVTVDRPGEVLAVQSTGTDWSGHWRKLTADSGRPGAVLWLSSGQPLLLIGWRHIKAGWRPRVHWFLPEDFLFGCEIGRHRSREQYDAGQW